MKIHFLPFLKAAGWADVATSEIFLNTSQSARELVQTFKHELAHIVSGDVTHGISWYLALKSFGGHCGLSCDPLPGWNATPNLGTISNVNSLLTDYHLLQAYRRTSQKILSTEGHWECVGEVNGDATEQKIRLYPTPKGSFPVMVVYYPIVTQFRSPQAKMIAYDMALAEAKCIVGATRRKIAGIPMPDGGNLTLDGEALAAEGKDEREALIERAIQLGEPLPIIKS